ncbi:MAG: AAA family ATPase [Pyrinomonadaceae bacterium]
MEAMTSTTVDLNDLVEIRPMNDWMRAASTLPVPKQLFDDLWREGELAILFGDTGKGKSALAVQIGESIARGRPMHPFGLTAKPRDVLLLDFEMTEKQIEMRYSADHDPDKGEALKKKYSFSKRFHRVVVRPEILYRHDGEPLETVLRDLLQPLITETGASVLIIDNITHLKRTAESYRETVPIMKELQRLKRRFGLSILVIAHTRKRDAKRKLSINDLQGAGSLASGADNVFAIGQSRRNSGERYIKHLKPRNAEAMYDGSHVPVFRLNKIGGNFLGFAFNEFASEAVLLAEPKEGKDWPMIERIKQMHDEKKSIRAIADELDLTKTSVHRYLQMWHPQAETETAAANAPSRPVYDPKSSPHYFPGREEYDAAADERRDLDDDYADEPGDNIESAFRNREGWIIEAASAAARNQYLETGIAPKLDDNEEYRAFQEAVRVYDESGGTVVQEPIEDIVRSFAPRSVESAPVRTEIPRGDLHGPHAAPFMYDGTPYAKAWLQHLLKSHPDRGDVEIMKDYQNAEPWCRPPGAIPIYDPDDPFSAMNVDFDEHRDRIFVEHESDDGKPRVWYKYDPNGLLHRYERDGNGVSRSRPNPNLFGRFVKRRRE